MLEKDTYLTIETNCEGLYKDKGSKFIAYAYPVSDENRIKEILSELKKEHHAARHHCYAYRMGADLKLFRANDDGEPSNSAGKPILGQIVSHELTNVLIVVVRYFGGTLLGVGGLINAYREAAADALANAQIVERLVELDIDVQVEYPNLDQVMRIAKDHGLKIVHQNFNLDCSIRLRVRKKIAPMISDKLSDIIGATVTMV